MNANMSQEYTMTKQTAMSRVRRQWRRFAAQVERQRRLEQIDRKRVSLTRFARQGNCPQA